MSQRYLGDGVYADFDGFNVTLTTTTQAPGEEAQTHTIVLEPDVVAALHRYAVEGYLDTRAKMVKLPVSTTVGTGIAFDHIYAPGTR
jgi:hypothetical protein